MALCQQYKTEGRFTGQDLIDWFNSEWPEHFPMCADDSDCRHFLCVVYKKFENGKFKEDEEILKAVQKQQAKKVADENNLPCLYCDR